MGGDFNEITCDADKMGGGPRPLRQMSVFNDALMYCGLHELGGAVNGFTWKGKRGDKIILERLDRIVGNRRWTDMFPTTRIRKLDFYGSDHCPVWCILKEDSSRLIKKGKGRFHFEDKWFMEKTFVLDVLCEWRQLEGQGDLSKKLSLCGKFMGLWAKNRCKVNAKTVENLRKERGLVMERMGESDAKETLDLLSKRIEEAVEIEALHWKQRSRTNWLANGDRNTGAFHAQASKRKKRNEITQIQDESGTLWKEEDIIKEYFSGLFKTTRPTEESIQAVMEAIQERVWESDYEILAKDFDAREVKRVVFDMHPTHKGTGLGRF